MNIDKYKDKAEYYAKYRPTYPEKCIESIIKRTGISNGDSIADIGAGTGIFTKLLFRNNYALYAVERSKDMFNELKKLSYHKFKIKNAPAEQTGIDSKSIDLIVVAQAFHWFNKAKFKEECIRILKNNSNVVLIWNQIDYSIDVGIEIAKLVEERTSGEPLYLIDLKSDNSIVDGFYKDNIYTKEIFNNEMKVTKEQFIGNYLSKSFSPTIKEDNEYKAYVNKLENIFDRFSENNLLVIPQNTFMYFGQI